jgi:IclR family KDG regulon transcriptional repressor
MKREKSNYLIQAVSHALDVLVELSRAQGEVGVTELSKRLKLHKNNVFRLLATLELRGYVVQNPQSENYTLGVGCLELGQSYLSNNTLIGRALPIIKNLSEEIGETASFAALHNSYITYPLSIESKRPVKVAARSATLTSAKNSVAGRLLTAQLSDAVLEEMLSGNTPQDAAIRSQLSELRNNGVIVDKGAVEPDVICLARIVRGLGNTVVGAIEVIMPQYRGKVEHVLPKLEAAATTLTTVLSGMQKKTLTADIETTVVDENSRTRRAENEALLNPRAR